MELTGWDQPGYDDSKWMPVQRTAIPLGTLRGAMAPNMKVVKQIKQVAVNKIGNKYVIDLGQNMAGWLKMRINNAKSGVGAAHVNTNYIRFCHNVYRFNELKYFGS
jgi:alpha-L-rhamnosidase